MTSCGLFGGAARGKVGCGTPRRAWTRDGDRPVQIRALRSLREWFRVSKVARLKFSRSLEERPQGVFRRAIANAVAFHFRGAVWGFSRLGVHLTPCKLWRHKEKPQH